MVAQVGSMTQQTPVINNELNPVWQALESAAFSEPKLSLIALPCRTTTSSPSTSWITLQIVISN